MRKKYFVLGMLVVVMFMGIVYGASTLSDVYMSVFPIKIDGKNYTSSTPVLNYKGRTYLCLKELGTALGNKIDFQNNEILIETKSINTIMGLAENVVLKNGKKVSLCLVLKNGKYYSNGDIESHGGREYDNNFSGDYYLVVCTDKDKYDSTKLYEYRLGENMFPGYEKLIVKDYNNDGNPDFCFSSDNMSLSWTGFTIFTILENGQIKKITSKEYLVPGFNGITMDLENVDDKTIKIKSYHGAIGKYYYVFYRYNEKTQMFEPNGNDLTKEDLAIIEEWGNSAP